jgi:hypothetical protein
LIQTSLGDDVEKDVRFENNSEEFITGSVFENVGIDVLNLKDLGLDIGFVVFAN